MSEREAASLVAAGEEAESSSDEEDATPAFKPGTVAGEEPETTSDEEEGEEGEGEEGEEEEGGLLPITTTAAARADNAIAQEENEDADADAEEAEENVTQEETLGLSREESIKGQAVIQAGVAVTVEAYVMTTTGKRQYACLSLFVGRMEERVRGRERRGGKERAVGSFSCFLPSFLSILESRCVAVTSFESAVIIIAHLLLCADVEKKRKTYYVLTLSQAKRGYVQQDILTDEPTAAASG
jgi:hypothetical protein